MLTEILSWNRQINLVTRVDTADRLEALVRSCEKGWELVAAALASAPRFGSASYIDLGSGSGLPGLVWALARRAAGHDGKVMLVEPRAKRAWFLRRTARLLGLEQLAVIEGRWGDVTALGDSTRAQDVLFSLKALRMDDHEVLAGLTVLPGPRVGPDHVWIARFLPSDPPEAVISEGEPHLPIPEFRAILGEGEPWLELIAFHQPGGSGD